LIFIEDDIEKGQEEQGKVKRQAEEDLIHSKSI